MTPKLCPHVQDLGKCRWLGTKVVTPGDWIKIMSPGRGIQNRFPGKKIVGRFYVPDEERFIRQGADGADEYYLLLWQKYYECKEDVFVWEACNEPVVNSIAQADALAAFLWRWLRLMHNQDYRTAVPAFSMGNPEMWVIPALRDVWEQTDYMSLHEYARRYMGEEDTPFLALRHRLIYDRMAELGIRQPPLLITECGIDRGGTGYRGKPGATPWPSYLSQLVWYERELQCDEYVTAAFVFSSGSTSTWKSFEIGEAEWRDLVKALA